MWKDRKEADRQQTGLGEIWRLALNDDGLGWWKVKK